MIINDSSRIEKRKLRMFIRNIVVTIPLVLLAACSLISTNRNMQARHEKEIKKLQDKIREKNVRIDQLNKSVTSLREELNIAGSTNEKLQQDYELINEEYNKELEASQNLRSDFKLLKNGYNEALAEIDAKEQKLSGVLAEQKEKQEKTRNLIHEKNERIADLMISKASLKEKLNKEQEDNQKIRDMNKSLQESQEHERLLREAIEEFKKDLQKGSMTYKPPDEMIKGEKKNLTLDIFPQQTVEELKRALSERSNIPIEDIKADAVTIYDRMFAFLSPKSSGLSVRAFGGTPYRDISDDKDKYTWNWQVEAIEEGEQELLLQVGIVLKYDKEEKPSIVFEEPKKIDVKVSKAKITSDFLRKNWQFIIQILVIPLAILIWEQIKKYRLKKRPD